MFTCVQLVPSKVQVSLRFELAPKPPNITTFWLTGS